ncbi:MAG: hypothetical protein CVU77_03320 [Elusimicrobia bacterium HGW-Elusimicrobia-1]|jgi:hypothetical protein|nr:MAG: hypothetical protein CVU77_03320 [Elusimicrobia bacterium HGW-Elusimicrobia-1]
MPNNFKKLKEDILDEINLLDQTLNALSDFKGKIVLKDANTDQKAVTGTYLMNFYTGVENIIKRVSKEYYQTLPKGASWHKELLDLSFDPPKNKIPIFTREIVNRLNPYRGFKHLFVSGYGFKLEMELMLSLINNVDNLWLDIKKAVTEFSGKL